jgi:hypothetical protein
MSGTFLNHIEKFHRIQTVGRNDKGILQNISTKVLYWIDHDSQWRSYLYDFDKYNPFCYLRKIFMYLLEGLSWIWIKWSLQVTANCKEIRNNGVNTAIVLVPYTPVFCFSGWHLRSWSSFMDMISSKSTLFSRVSPPHKVSISWNWCFAENFPTGLTSGPSG